MDMFATAPRKLVFLDTESTGLSPYKDKLIEIGFIVYENGQVKRTFSTLLNPGKPIPWFITKITGIDDFMVKGKPKFHEISDELLETLNESILVAHNARFDYSFLQNEFLNIGVDFTTDHMCTVKLSKLLHPTRKKHTLDEFIAEFNLNCENRHRALDDAEILYQVYEILRKQMGQERLEEIMEQIIKRK